MGFRRVISGSKILTNLTAKYLILSDGKVKWLNSMILCIDEV
ncbi:hypothetical protein [Clostridium septicum]|nr:hypothetical protein [Clostridium septicum]MDU1315443.1 hypothetical protein [Clostridium septicum]